MASAAGGAFRRFLNSETGPKTVHFWAPTFKWALVFAGISDISRPVDKLSGTQNLSLLATGVIWTRWSFVIRPKNMLLASVNFFLGGTAGYQLTRIINYRKEQGDTPGQIMSYVLNGPKAPEDKVRTLQGSDAVGSGNSIGQSSTA
ncbi:LADA_0B00914g1_1 [Lachancea dasiensis]|uniref:Mitochondrial pyruvate carrier n=1 Tax=Lachancea dasiensis TaxID=1072105 RepID=A0A1G4IRL0_9SACH|nr:LADA_0B00914g1_1 [Lachancea dasiensis]